MKIIILGAGRVGAPMALDLIREDGFQVSIADIDAAALKRLEPYAALTLRHKDLGNPAEVTELVKDYDMVVNAVPGWLGFQTYKAVIEAGRNVVDIAFFPEDPFVLDRLAKERGVTAIMDCGVAPGMSNILVGYASHILDDTVTALIYVGGLPVVREQPYEYKAVFSPIDVIEEYTRPARYVENGKLVVREALSDPEYLNFPGIGTLEAFNTDGLRTLAQTIKAPNMKEKTMRYPGHIQKMALLRETGFFSQEPIEIQGIKLRPLDFTAKLLFPVWQLQEGEQDFTVMRVVVEGSKSGRRLRYTYDLFDRYDTASRTTSMARTTGYTATMAVRMLERGRFKDKGVIVPEYIGRYPECVSFLLEGLKDRGVVYKETITTLD